MNQVDIIGVGLLSPGGTLDETWQFMLDGKSGRLIERFKPQEDRLILLAQQSMDAAIKDLPEDVPIDALCIGSTSASFYEVENSKERLPSYLEELAEIFEIKQYFQFSQACSSSGYAIAMGADMIRMGLAEVVLAGGVDELTQCVEAAFTAVKLHTDRCRPFNAKRTGLVLSEASAFVLMAKKGIGEPLCHLGGIGLSCDAFDAAAPSKEGIKRAIVQAMSDVFYPVEFVIAHGTGTKLGDKIELEAICEAMEEVCLPRPIVSSYKGSLGHPQGASGAVGVVLGVKAIQSNLMFPTVGINDGEQDVGIGISIATTPISAILNRVLCLSYGSWGTNSAILLGAV